LKKTLIAFAIAFVLAVGLSYAYKNFTSTLLRYFPSNTSFETVSAFNTIFTLIIFSVGVVLSFVVFYFSALRIEITVSKKTTLSIFLGSLAGALLFVLVVSTVLGSPVFSGYIILANVASFCSLVGVFLCFFPALIAVLYAEVKEKKTSLPR
jgi:hypothetical protein